MFDAFNWQAAITITSLLPVLSPATASWEFPLCAVGASLLLAVLSFAPLSAHRVVCPLVWSLVFWLFRLGGAKTFFCQGRRHHLRIGLGSFGNDKPGASGSLWHAPCFPVPDSSDLWRAKCWTSSMLLAIGILPWPSSWDVASWCHFQPFTWRTAWFYVGRAIFLHVFWIKLPLSAQGLVAPSAAGSGRCKATVRRVVWEAEQNGWLWSFAAAERSPSFKMLPSF